MCGILLSRALPPHHLGADSKDTVRMGMGLVATMAALVLGLLVSSAKSFYDAQSTELTQLSVRVILLERLLAHYGPETKEARDLLRGAVAGSIDRIWPQERTQPSKLGTPSSVSEALVIKIQALSPKDDRQRSLQAQALSTVIDLYQTRWLMYEQGSGSVSKPMLVILVFWLAAIFATFGLFAPHNATVIIFFVCCHVIGFWRDLPWRVTVRFRSDSTCIAKDTPRSPTWISTVAQSRLHSLTPVGQFSVHVDREDIGLPLVRERLRTITTRQAASRLLPSDAPETLPRNLFVLTVAE